MNLDQVDSLLSSSVSVSKYWDMEKKKDKGAIANFIYERFSERYVTPFNCRKKNGFIMMASACLMIEALESFRRGWKKSPKSELAFCSFFDRVSRFSSFKGHSQEFYINIRCGIMHQGETTGGWHVRRDKDAPLFNSETLTIQATKFLCAMKMVLVDYREQLKEAAWDSYEWKNLRKKMKYICANTRKA